MILIPIGTKAQLIKMAPVILALKERCVPFHFVLTGQHSETMEDLIRVFNLPKPDYSLVPVDEAYTAVRLLRWLCQVFFNHLKMNSPFSVNDYTVCLVHGDTVSTLVAAVLARRHSIKVAHVEAGLRSHDFFNPFPEEIVRLIVSRLSHVHYCSGEWAVENLNYLKADRVNIVNIFHNTIIDSARYALGQKKNKENDEVFGIVSIHRFENLSSRRRFEFIMNQVVKIRKKIKLKFILHPATREKIRKSKWDVRLIENGIELVPRMNYVEFSCLVNNSKFVITDGGSNQEECAFFDVPCLLFRKATERIEGLGLNTVISNYREEVICDFIKKSLKKNSSKKKKNSHIKSPSVIIVDHLVDTFCL